MGWSEWSLEIKTQFKSGMINWQLSKSFLIFFGIHINCAIDDNSIIMMNTKLIITVVPEILVKWTECIVIFLTEKRIPGRHMHMQESCWLIIWMPILSFTYKYAAYGNISELTSKNYSLIMLTKCYMGGGDSLLYFVFCRPLTGRLSTLDLPRKICIKLNSISQFVAILLH